MRKLYTALLVVPTLAFAQNDYDARIDDYRGHEFACGGQVTPVLRIQNMGSMSMTSCVVETWKNGVVDNSFDWILAVPAATGEFRQPAFPPVAVVPGDQLEFRIISVNDEPDQDPNGNLWDIVVSADPEFAASHVVLVEVLTDAAPAETSWLLRNHLAQVVATAGPYVVPDALEETWLTLPAGQCFALEVNDAGADGMSTGHVKLYSDAVEVIFIGGGDFTDVAVANLETGLTTGVPDRLHAEMRLFPVPAADLITLIWDEAPRGAIELAVFDVQGRQVLAHRMAITGPLTIDLSGVENGIYVVRASASDGGSWDRRVLVVR